MAPKNENDDGVKRVRRVTRKKAASDSAPAKKAAAKEKVDRPVDEGAPKRPNAFMAVGGVRQKDITVFLRQLIMMLEAGTPLLKALKGLAERGRRGSVKALINDIAQYVEVGNPLWQAFERHPKHFDTVFVNLIRASEASGTLTDVLERLVHYRERREMMIKRVRGAMFYPVILVGACIGAVIFLNIMVLPAFRELFNDLDIPLPKVTRTVMGISDFISSTWLIALIVVVALVLFYKLVFVRNPLNRIMADRIKLRIPIMGPILRKASVSEFARTLGMLLKSGLSMLGALDLVRDSIHNRAYTRVIEDMRDSVEQGGGLEEPLRRHEFLIPSVVTDMLVTGEESGQLDQIAEQIADTYEEEVSINLASLGEAIQPILTIFLGAVVATIVLAFFLPLLKMIDSLNAAS